MNAQKLPIPTTGAPKTGSLQFGDELPGIYLTAEDAFALSLKLADVTSDADRIPSGELFEEEELECTRDSIEIATQSLHEATAELRQLLALCTFGSATHVKQMHRKPGATLKAAA